MTRQRDVKGKFLPRAVPHGTPQGYRQHKRNGTPACDPCKAAWAARSVRYRAGRELLTPEQSAHQQAMKMAVNKLALIHKEELRQLYLEARESLVTDVPVAGPQQGNTEKEARPA